MIEGSKDWVKSQLKNGISESEIRTYLLKNGHRKSDIDEVLRQKPEKVKFVELLAGFIGGAIFVIFPIIYFGASNLLLYSAAFFIAAYMFIIANFLKQDRIKSQKGSQQKILAIALLIIIILHSALVFRPFFTKTEQVPKSFEKIKMLLDEEATINIDSTDPEAESLSVSLPNQAPVLINISDISSEFDNMLDYYENEVAKIDDRIAANLLQRKETAITADLMDYDSMKTEVMNNIIKLCSKIDVSIRSKIQALSTYCENKGILLKCKEQEIQAAEKLVEFFLNIGGKGKQDCLDLLGQIKFSEDCENLNNALGESTTYVKDLEEICNKLK